MRENRPYGLEGGESGSTGLPYPYPNSRLSAGDPLPLRLCVFAPLRLFFRAYIFKKAAFSKLCNLSHASCISSTAPLAISLKQKLSRPFLRVFPLGILRNRATLARFFTVPDQVS
jgi:hypothetical protein